MSRGVEFNGSVEIKDATLHLDAPRVSIIPPYDVLYGVDEADWELIRSGAAFATLRCNFAGRHAQVIRRDAHHPGCRIAAFKDRRTGQRHLLHFSASALWPKQNRASHGVSPLAHTLAENSPPVAVKPRREFTAPFPADEGSGP